MDLENVFNIFPSKEIGEIQADEYVDDRGLPYCKNCKTERFFEFEVDGEKTIIRRCRCKCQEEKLKKELQNEERQKNLERFKERQKLSMLGKKYLDARFDTATITNSNKEAYSKCSNYVKNSKVMAQQNLGLYIYGENSSGKSHLLACICNELVAQGYSCIYTSVPRMLAEIQNSYSDNAAMGQAQLTNLLSRQSFVFIDDLGKEFLGRETNSGAAKFAEKVFLEVLNARYNNGLPTIFSSNYSISELAEQFNLDKAILERINEMATRIIKLEGDNFRDKALNEKNEIAKKYGI